MSTTAYALISDPQFVEFKKHLEDQISQIEKLAKEKGDSGLSKRFEDLKAETEKVLNKFAEDGKILQTSLETLAKSQEETIKKLNLTIDEVRSIGGKNLPKPANPEPVKKVSSGMGLTMFDVFDEGDEGNE